jgi:hypothetical protein
MTVYTEVPKDPKETGPGRSALHSIPPKLQWPRDSVLRDPTQDLQVNGKALATQVAKQAVKQASTSEATDKIGRIDISKTSTTQTVAESSQEAGGRTA